MNRDTLKGDWKNLKGQVQAKWGKLTNDDLDIAQGKFDTLVGSLQKRYGLAKDRAEHELDSFISTMGGKNDPNKVNVPGESQINAPRENNVNTPREPNQVQTSPKEKNFDEGRKDQPSAR